MKIINRLESYLSDNEYRIILRNSGVNIVNYDNDFKFHFDTNVRIRSVTEIDSHANFVFQLSYLRKENTYEVPAIMGFVKEIDYVKKEIIDLNCVNDKDIVWNNKFENTKINNGYKEFEKKLDRIQEDKDV